MSAELRDQLAAALPEHQSWCHGEAHAECCGAGDCDCGVTGSLERLLPTVQRLIAEAVAGELRDRAAMVRARAAEEEDDLPDVADALDEVSSWLNARAAALDPS